MTLYLDNSFLNRPFDDPDIKMNRLEGEMLFLIIELAGKGEIRLVNSSAIEYENSLNPYPERKSFVVEVLNEANIHQNLNDQIKIRAKHLAQETGITPIDALHLATAEYARVDFFITCDYNLIKKYKGSLKVIKPLDFLNYYENPTN